MTQALAVAGWIIVIVGALTAIGGAARWGWRILTKLSRLTDALLGEPPGPGVPHGRPGLLDRMTGLEENARSMDERLSFIESQMRPNGGTTLRDTVDRIASATETTTTTT